MSGIFPLALICITASLWFVTWLSSHRLLHAFCNRFPSVAQREIPYAFDRGFAHPEKVMFFFRKRAAGILRADPVLWRQRQWLFLFSSLSVFIPVLGFVIIGIVAIIESTT